jgi:hypothetical protein
MQKHQHKWRELEVDKGILDEWLEFMNDLVLFSVYSTCEGHRDLDGVGGCNHARIWLSLRDQSYLLLEKMWENK